MKLKGNNFIAKTVEGWSYILVDSTSLVDSKHRHKNKVFDRWGETFDRSSV